MSDSKTIKVDLYWQLIPMYIYRSLAGKTGQDAYYNPFFGKGIYLHILSGIDGKQLYGVGMSDSEIGNRLMHHYYGITGEKDDYWLPLDPQKARADLYDPDIKWGHKSGNEERHAAAGQFLVDYSYFAIAPLPVLADGNQALSHAEKLRDIEAILQHAFTELRFPEGKHKEREVNVADWHERIGCRRRDLSEMKQSYKIVSYYSNATIERFIAANLPARISFP